MKHFFSKNKKEFKMIIAVAVVLAMAIIGAKSIYAIFTVSKTKANTLGIRPTHTVTYSYFEVDRNGTKTPIERTESYKDFEGTTITLGSDSSHQIVSDRYSTVKYVIDGSLRWDIRDLLDQWNISERTVFPGLDGLSTWLKRYYFVK